MIGDIIDKYQIVKKLGEGGMATVYHGRHVTLHRDVAIKILHPGLASTERNRQRFAREARAIEQLDHSNILKILDYSGSEGEQCFIVTELIDGLTLRQIMEEYPRIPSEVVAQIGIELCKALEYAHRRGLIHRDIKPENVMLRNDGVIKLMDFGIARFAEESQLTLTGTLVGSPAYMSPEQALENPIDHRSDLFSLGILLFQLATGELPFLGSNPSVILKNIIDNQRSQAHTILPEISIKLSDTIDKLLQSSVDNRPKTSTEVIEDIAAVFEESNLDINEDGWSLKYWLIDPENFNNKLRCHLSKSLLDTGKGLMEKGRHLEAQQFLNRLLSIDTENEEVFELIQFMHTNPEIPSIKEKKQWWPFVLPIIFTAGLFMLLQPNQMPEQTIIDEPTENTSEVENLLPIEPPPTSDITDSTEVETIKNLAIIKKTNQPRVMKKKPKVNNNLPLKKDTSALNISAKSKQPEQPILKGKITVSIPNSWADIWIDNIKVGRTGQIEPIEVMPGEHELKLMNKYSLPYIEKFTISSGEKRHIEILSLKRRPAFVVFPSQYNKDCLVKIDNIPTGTLGALNYKLTINEPNLPHQIDLQCEKSTMKTEIPQMSPGSTIPIQFQ